MNDLAITNAPTQSSALAKTDQQRAIAEVQAALFIARQNPRNMVTVLDKVLNAFARPGLAEVAEYEYARGGTNISGPSIRAAEAIAQIYGNNQYGFRELARWQDDTGVGVSEVESFCWDVENNVRRAVTVNVRHWRDTKQGGKPLTDERDIYEITANMAQRRVRACILSVLPGDIIETAMAQVALTMKASADTSPEAMAKMCEAFAAYGVTRDQIETRIQRRLDAIQPAQVVQLKRIYASLRDGMSTPESWFQQGANDDAEPKRKSAAPTTGDSVTVPGVGPVVLTPDPWANSPPPGAVPPTPPPSSRPPACRRPRRLT